MITQWFYDNIYQPVKSLFSSNSKIENDIAQVTMNEMGHISVPVDDNHIDFLMQSHDDII